MNVRHLCLAGILTALSLTFACGKPAVDSIFEKQSPPQTHSTPSLFLQFHQLVLDWPVAVRMGDVSTIHLTFKSVQNDGVEPTRLFPEVPADDGINDPIQYDVITEARLDLPRAVIRPQGLVSQPLPDTQNLTFTWSFLIQEPGPHQGTAWFTLYLIPRGPEEGETTTPMVIPVAAIPFEVRVVSIAGMTGGSARAVGLGLLTILFALGLPGMIKRIAAPKENETGKAIIHDKNNMEKGN